MNDDMLRNVWNLDIEWPFQFFSHPG